MVKIIANSILGLILIFIWTRFVNLNQIFSRISGTNKEILLLVLVFMLLSPTIRAFRLKIILSEIRKIRLLDLIFLNGAAMMLNFFVPIRAGEFLKGFYLNNRYGLHLGKSIIWIFVDRFVDFLYLFLAVTLLVRFVPTSLLPSFINTSLIVFLILLVFTYLVVFKANFSRKLVNFLKPYLIEKHIKIYFERFSYFILDSFTILDRHPKDLFIIAITTVLAYGADAAIWYFTFIALGVKEEYLKMYLGQLLSGLTYLIPAAPGYVGSAEASGLLILSGIFRIDNNLASAMIVLFHILSAVFVLAFGLIGVFSLKLKLGLIFNKVLKKKS